MQTARSNALKVIAGKWNISISTVFHMVNNKNSVKKETRKRVCRPFKKRDCAFPKNMVRKDSRCDYTGYWGGIFRRIARKSNTLIPRKGVFVYWFIPKTNSLVNSTGLYYNNKIW